VGGYLFLSETFPGSFGAKSEKAEIKRLVRVFLDGIRNQPKEE
jgi:hypothetical protein